MKSKKFVLAALALLAITSLLALAGCKNDSVSETPAAKLVSISVTTLPARTVYSVGQSFDPTGMVVTATYNAGEPKDVTSLATTDFDFSSAGVKTVTVSYSEGGSPVTKDFTVDVVNVEEPTKLTSYTSPNHTGSKWTYVAFGEWPQTIMKAGVTVDESEGKQMGMFTYYLGSDGNHYVKEEEKACEAGYKYSDGSDVNQKDESGSPSTRWFKVEPIVWRVLTENYIDADGNGTGNALLLAEKILTGGIPYYVDRNTRTITGAGTKQGEPDTVCANNWQYSTIRAWLNGSYEANDTQNKTYTGKGFLQTAFTADAQSLIADTSVDNSAASTIPSGITDEDLESDWGNDENLYASDTPTTDKIFLLSEEEATTLNSGFDEYNKYVGDGTTLTSTRIRDTTDYAKATGADQSSTEGYGGCWWLRSPFYLDEDHARVISSDGYAYDIYSDVGITAGGVVPALSISLK